MAKAKVTISEGKRTAVEQAIARGWSIERIVTTLGVTEAEYKAVVAAMERRCRS